MLKWSVTTLSGRSCKWERMDAIPFLHTSEMWPRIQTPPGVLLRSHTMFGSVSLHLQLLLLQRDHITEDDGGNDHHLWGEKKHLSMTGVQCKGSISNSECTKDQSPKHQLCPNQVLDLNHLIFRVCHRNQPLGGAEDIIYYTSLNWFHYITGVVCSCYSWILHAYNPAGEPQHIQKDQRLVSAAEM